MIADKTVPTFIHTRLPVARWHEEKKQYENRISELIDDYLQKRQNQQQNPVVDFLFEYYSFRPSHLKRWTPGCGVLLEKSDRASLPELSELKRSPQGVFLDPNFFPDNRKSSVRWILNVLEKSADRDPSFGCFGMHEWAMVYKKDAEDVRHNQFPLRMSKQELAQFVESRPLVCTHFDAFRFFSDEGRPLNKFELSREKFDRMEQPGCLHTNIDLYKWAFKFYPWISSSTIGDAFELALEARHIDMKASPYDLTGMGLEPIRIETEEGRKKYLREQKAIYEKSQPVRRQLMEEYRYLVTCFDC